MKILVAGAQRIKGTSKAGNAFDMCTITTLVPVESVNNPKVSIQGHGFKTMEMNLDPACLADFAAMKGPSFFDVTLEPRPHMGKYETTVVAVTKAA